MTVIVDIDYFADFAALEVFARWIDQRLYKKGEVRPQFIVVDPNRTLKLPQMGVLGEYGFGIAYMTKKQFRKAIK